MNFLIAKRPKLTQSPMQIVPEIKVVSTVKHLDGPTLTVP
jgi:hypothetical protein